MEHNDKNAFQYTYSAREREELKSIRARYEQSPKDCEDAEDKMARVRRLDNAVTQKAQVVALVFGVIGALVMGFGMSLVMSELSVLMGISNGLAWTLGLLLGLIGGVLVALAYPMYHLVTRRERAKIADEILRLTDELMK